MKRLFVARNLAVGAALAIAFAGAPSKAADDLPKADTILDKSVEVTGGKTAYQKIHTEVATGSFEVGAMGIKGTMASYKAEPDKVLTEIEIQGFGKMLDGSNGKVAWSNNPMQGPHVKEGDEKEMALLMGKFDSEFNWRSQFPKVETVGSETIDGKDCYKVVLTPKTGKPMTRYYDKKSGLLVKSIMTVTTAMGEVNAESLFDDYRKEGDILSPHKLTQKAMGQEFTVSIEKVQFNTEIPASKFDVPAEIQALIDKK